MVSIEQCLSVLIMLVFGYQLLQAQPYDAGFKTLVLIDSSRIYKPETTNEDKLHYRPVELDIWYPAHKSKTAPLPFGDLFRLFEQRAVRYDDQEDFSGLTNELAQYYVAELGLQSGADELLTLETQSFLNATPIDQERPVILYMAGFNGMGFENYRVLEKLAQEGYVVVAIWSVGRYPGNMTNQKEDMMEQVYDAEFAMEYLRKTKGFQAEMNRIGVLGCSWGGMSAAVLVDRNPIISSMVSFDGTETHYFGEPDNNIYYGGADGADNDSYIRAISDQGLLNPESQQINYLYIESDDKIDDFIPTDEYHYYKKLNSSKYYLRLLESSHADFTCIPAILKASVTSVNIYELLEETTLDFFNSNLKSNSSFDQHFQQLERSPLISNKPFDYSERKATAVKRISGKVFDKKTRGPLTYVNVGILNKGFGTVTDSTGQFSFNIPAQEPEDTLRISMIGYKPYIATLQEIEAQLQTLSIGLIEEIRELDEVVLVAKAYKKKVLGNQTKSKFLGTGFSHDQLGAEMGIKISVNRQTMVDSFNFYISYNRLSAKSIFRFNIYNVKKGKPVENLLNEQILIPIDPGQTGEIRTNLKPFGIVLEDDVIIALEWVDVQGVNKKDEAIFFSLGLMNSGTLHKESSHAPFKKFNSLGVGFNLDVRQ